jgi:hypothetical protein
MHTSRLTLHKYVLPIEENGEGIYDPWYPLNQQT